MSHSTVAGADAEDSMMDPPRTDSTIDQPPLAAKTTLVFESHVSINPRDTCLANHHDGKRAANPFKQCRSADCYESHFDPPQAKPAFYRMLTADRLSDLRRWLTTPNFRHGDGKRRERQREAEFIGSHHFTLQNLRDALTYAIEKFKETLAEVDHLAAYFEQRYQLYFRDLCRDAVHVSQLPNAAMIAAITRPDAVYEMIRATTQIDYLKDEIERLNSEIVKIKWQKAKEGSDFEIRELLRLGFIELEQESGNDEGVLKLG